MAQGIFFPTMSSFLRQEPEVLQKATTTSRGLLDKNVSKKWRFLIAHATHLKFFAQKTTLRSDADKSFFIKDLFSHLEAHKDSPGDLQESHEAITPWVAHVAFEYVNEYEQSLSQEEQQMVAEFLSRETDDCTEKVLQSPANEILRKMNFPVASVTKKGNPRMPQHVNCGGFWRHPKAGGSGADKRLPKVFDALLSHPDAAKNLTCRGQAPPSPKPLCELCALTAKYLKQLLYQECDEEFEIERRLDHIGANLSLLEFDGRELDFSARPTDLAGDEEATTDQSKGRIFFAGLKAVKGRGRGGASSKGERARAPPKSTGPKDGKGRPGPALVDEQTPSSLATKTANLTAARLKFQQLSETQEDDTDEVMVARQTRDSALKEVLAELGKRESEYLTEQVSSDQPTAMTQVTQALDIVAGQYKAAMSATGKLQKYCLAQQNTGIAPLIPVGERIEVPHQGQPCITRAYPLLAVDPHSRTKTVLIGVEASATYEAVEEFWTSQIFSGNDDITNYPIRMWQPEGKRRKCSPPIFCSEHPEVKSNSLPRET